MLTFVQKRGNKTFYEWRTGKAPSVVERSAVEEAPAEAVTEDTVGKKSSYMHKCVLFITAHVFKIRLTGGTLVLGPKRFLLP